MNKKQVWTKDKSVESLLKVIESGKNNEVITAIRLLNSMYGLNEPQDENKKFEGKIEIVFIEPSTK